MSRSPQLRQLVIKPSLECTANCPTCALRLRLYDVRRPEPTLSLHQWRQVIEDGRAMGCTELHISGGEPTLYPELKDLIAAGAALGMRVNVNTNGGRMTADLAGHLQRVAGTSVTVSLYSWRAEIHDRMRQEPGLFGRAVESVRLVRRSRVQIDLQTLLTRLNLLDFTPFLEMAYELEVGFIYVSYLEGDVEGRALPTADQILRFRREVLPEVSKVIVRRAPDGLRDATLHAAGSLFSDAPGRVAEFAEGHYFPSSLPACPRPHNFALVLANGEVHPCNGIEYTHDPVMGNVRDRRLPELWLDEPWQRFRATRHDWCHRCPMTLHFRIPITGAVQ